jgi:hypothetical protein
MPRVDTLAGACLATLVGVGAAVGQDSRTLPVPEVLYRAVRENLVRAERVAHLYAYQERRTDVHTNPFGRVGTGGTRVFEVYPSPTPGLIYRRLVQRNDVRVTVDELADQDRDYRRRVADVQRRSADRRPEARSRAEQEASRARDRRQRRIEDVVEALRFTLEGRTVYDGRPAITISFAPRPDAKPETREGRMAVKFEGTIWIDEAASEVMHVEGTSIDDITFGWGLAARVRKGASASLTRRPVADGLWMPTQIRLTGSGSAALFRRLVIDFAVDWFDYRRLEAHSATPFLDPAEPRLGSW